MPFEGLRVLLVEDSDFIRERIADMLEGMQMQVTQARDGQAALERFEAGERFDLVLTDLMMPRLDGMGLCAALRQRDDCRQLPIIVLSAEFEGGCVSNALDQGADDFLTKPFSAPQLEDVLHRSLG